MRKLSGEQFAVCTRPQVEAAEQILADLRRASAAACSCAGQWPCPVAESYTQSPTRRSQWRRLACAGLGGERV